MPNLKLHRDEPEPPPPEPLPFDSAAGSWRQAGHQADQTSSDDIEGAPMDSIKRVEEALGRVESNLENLSEQVDEYCEPIKLSDWINDDDDGPWAA